MEDRLEMIKDYLMTHGLGVVQAIVIFALGWIGAKIAAGLLRKVLRRAKIEETLVGFIGNMAYMAILALVIIATIEELGVDTTSFAAVIAAAGLAIGFALQGSLANFAAGVMIMFFRPYRVGDYIEAAGTAGKVDDLQVFYTVMTTPDNKRITVPNASITGGNIINYSALETRRIDLVFGIGYGDDIKKAKGIIEQVLANHELVRKDPEPTVAVGELADSSVNFVVRPWVKTSDYWTVRFDLTEAIKLEFDRQGVSIPFPQRDVHMHQVPSAA